ncbi:MAG: hypothetical protein V2A73_11440, partial [Pseudomonadota bacterium]
MATVAMVAWLRGFRANKARCQALFRRAQLLVIILLVVASAVLAYRRFHVPKAKEEILWYFRNWYQQSHAETKSIQSAIASLFDDATPTTPQTAVLVLDDNIVPSIDRVIGRARVVRLESVEVMALHAAYLQALEGMRQDVLSMRGVFVDPALSPAEKKYR